MLFRLPLVGLAALAATACSAKPDAKAAPPRTATANGETAAPASDSAKRPTARTASNDPRGCAVIAGRNGHDTVSFFSAIRAGTRAAATWPKGPAAPAGALLPAKRIVAFYGNPLSKKMGVLGEYPVDEMLAKLDQEVDRWRKADPNTPVQPALHLIAVVAQGAAGRDGMWRTRMDTALIEKVYGWAQKKNALLFLDVQVGHSTLQAELPRLVPFLSRPNVHLGIDPEFSMHYEREGLPPGRKIGEMDAADVNYAVKTLATLTAEKHLPPKILIVHRFTRKMVSNASQIRLDPNVQVVMDMDGWGPPWLKFDSYRDYIVAEPVQFTGFKLFFHNDIKKKDLMITPAELLCMNPKPLYIQYQ